MLKADICLIFRGLFAVHRLYLIRIYLMQFYLILIHLIRHIDNLHDTVRRRHCPRNDDKHLGNIDHGI